MGLIALFNIITIAASAVASPPISTTDHGVWPLSPHRVVRGFEPPLDAYSAGHRGADLAGSLGDPVVAAMGGTISFAGMIAGRGVIVIDHGDTRTTYEPVLALVRAGDRVESDQQIGTLDVTQGHCFPSACLHWGWLRADEYLDPLLLVPTLSRVRLLPLDPARPADGPDDRRP